MWLKKLFCIVLACMLVVGFIGVPADASEIGVITSEIVGIDLVSPCASGSFNMTIPAESAVSSNTGFPLEAGETVTIRASYLPSTASVDFGLIAPDGKYYYFNITNGNIFKTMQVPESGTYILRIRNNSKVPVEVSGYVNY